VYFVTIVAVVAEIGFLTF